MDVMAVLAGNRLALGMSRIKKTIQLVIVVMAATAKRRGFGKRQLIRVKYEKPPSPAVSHVEVARSVAGFAFKPLVRAIGELAHVLGATAIMACQAGVCAHGLIVWAPLLAKSETRRDGKQGHRGKRYGNS